MASDAPAIEEPSILKDKEFWAELVSTGGVGALLFFVLHLKDIGQVAWILGALLVFHRYVLINRMNKSLSPVIDQLSSFGQQIQVLGQFVDLSLRVNDTALLREVVDNFYHITEFELQWHRNEAVERLNRSLKMLYQQKRSRTMFQAEYYGWLLPRINQAPAGSEIWAISMMMSCEWDESPEEAEFLKENLDAALRGVKVTRLFICTADVWTQAKSSLESVRRQLAAGGDLHVYFGDIDAIRRRDATVLSALGDGLIAFDRRVLLIDEHSEDGSARGYISISAAQITRMRQHFDSLRNLCKREYL